MHVHVHIRITVIRHNNQYEVIHIIKYIINACEGALIKASNDYLFTRVLAADVDQLSALGVTHVLNAAQGTGYAQVATDKAFYRPAGISYLGIQADDTPSFKLAPYFTQAVDFITLAIASGGM